MPEKPHLLLTNDDGITAPGLRHLWRALKEHYRLTIVAPASEQSGVGLSITSRSPLYIRSVEWEDASAYSISGTPVDCVKMARSVILQESPDLIISGINCGSNAGRNVLYSGTVAGVIEGTTRGVSGIAFSTGDSKNSDYSSAETWIPTIVAHVLEHPMPRGTVLNVNFPKAKLGPYRGIKLTRQGRRHYTENPSEHQHPIEGHSYYWLGCRTIKFDEHEDSDIHWLERGYVTAVPLHVEEFTDHSHLREHKDCFEASVQKAQQP